MNNVSKENVISNGDAFQRFSHISHLDINKHALNKHAICKKKHARGNQMPFFNKELWKAIWYGLNYETFSYEIEMRKINKELFASLLWNNLWKYKWQIFCGQQTLLKNSKTSPLW